MTVSISGSLRYANLLRVPASNAPRAWSRGRARSGRKRQLPAQDAGKSPGPRAHARNAREHQRAAVNGLSAIIAGSPGATASRHPVLNVSEQGMLIPGLVEPVGAPISFVLAGCGIDNAGSGRVAHRRGRSAGVAIDHLHGAPEAIRALVRSETDVGPPAEAYISQWSWETEVCSRAEAYISDWSCKTEIGPRAEAYISEWS